MIKYRHNVSICPVLMWNNQRRDTHPAGQSLTAAAEGPEHRVALTLQNLLQHLQRDKRAESESWVCFGFGRSETETSYGHCQRPKQKIWKGCFCFFPKKQLSSSRYLVRRRCCCAAALQQQERRQALKQFPLAEVMTASNTWGERGISSQLRVNKRLIKQQCPALTCGKHWVFSAWLKVLRFVHRQQNNSRPAATTAKT